MFHAQKRLETRTGLDVPIAILENCIKRGEAKFVRHTNVKDRVIYQVKCYGILTHCVWSQGSQIIITVLPYRKCNGYESYAEKKQKKRAFFRDLRNSGEKDADSIEITGDESYGVAS